MGKFWIVWPFSSYLHNSKDITIGKRAINQLGVARCESDPMQIFYDDQMDMNGQL